MSIENSFRPDLEPVDEFVESGGVILEHSDNNNPDDISKPIRWICGKGENEEHINPLGITDPIYIHLGSDGRWEGTTIKPIDMGDWDIH